jgi:phosphatidyl-myo-inositol alpha-mannosyltransferase
MAWMRIALVSPYSWTYPGGVTRHIEALAQEYIRQGHDVRVLAPYDPPDLTSSIVHRGARPQRLAAPDYLVSLGRTVGFKANGAVSNLSIGPGGIYKLSKELRTGNYDVAHIHEPVAPMVGWVAASQPDLPLVGTFHSYSNKRIPNYIANSFGATQLLNRLHVRIAVSEAAAWTGRRWFGGRYRVIPNGVHLDPQLAYLIEDDPAGLAAAVEDELGGVADDPVTPLRIVFVGQAVERKGLPLLLRAFEALREHVPTELTVIGPSKDELAPLLMDSAGVRMLGKVDDATKHFELRQADVLCAPSLGGESFGMVLTEAFAAGTTVVASDIAGYRDVVTDGRDGVLIAPGDAQTLAEVLRDLHDEPQRQRQLAEAATSTVQRFAWEHVAQEVMKAYTDAIEVPKHVESTAQRLALRVGVLPADRQPRVKAQKLPSLERPLAPQAVKRGVLATVRRVALLALTAAVIGLAYWGLEKIGISNIGNTLINSSPTFVLLGLVTMCSAMVMRGLSWDAILRAALPNNRLKLMDVIRATMIGVLMSSTLPARLGEPARALVIARRTGKARENFPVVLGTLVSQTAINIVALIVLGAVMFSSVDFFAHHQNALLVAAIVPAALLVFVLMAPIILKYGPGGSRTSRAHRASRSITAALGRVRTGLQVFRDLRLGTIATVTQLAAWALQWISCFLLLNALGIEHHGGIAAAAAVLFAVNITAVVPATPANLGVFQFACATVLNTGWHVSWGTGVAYGVILQAVEVTTAILLGTPALLKEGMSWREVRLRAMHSTPIKLPPRPSAPSRRRQGDTVETI